MRSNGWWGVDWIGGAESMLGDGEERSSIGMVLVVLYWSEAGSGGGVRELHLKMKINPPLYAETVSISWRPDKTRHVGMGTETVI